jgi:mannitol-specific phosphotransferase system IIBC component
VPGTVQSFEAYQLGSSALFLVWKKPEQPNGILTGYKIYYQTVKGTKVGRASICHSLGACRLAGAEMSSS